MRFLIIGAGSMGQRRIRNLLALEYPSTDITVYDADENRAKTVAEKYDTMYQTVLSYFDNKADAIIVSVPPLQKQQLIDFGNRLGLPVFVEADICLYHGNYYPSATMRFHPGIAKIKELLDKETLGEVYTFTYHMGQHLRDWHLGEDYTKYYAAKKESGGCREMMVFELSWLSYLFGMPIDITGFIDKKLSDPDITADDVYSTTVKFYSEEALAKHTCGLPIFPSRYEELKKQFTVTGTVLIDTVSRPAIRELRIAGEKGVLFWEWSRNHIDFADMVNGKGVIIQFNKGQAAPGYNENIGENMYENELQNWISSIKGEETYRYSREEEESIMKMLAKVEGT